MLIIFSCVCWPSIFFGELFRSFANFLIELFGFLLLSYMSSIYILDINHLSDKWFAKSFSHSVGFFILLIVSFAMLKVKKLDVILLIYFWFVACAFGVISKKIIAKTHVNEFFPMFSSGSFMVSGLIFKF